MVLCVGYGCKLIPAFMGNVRGELNILGTKSLLCFHHSSLFLDFISEIKLQTSTSSLVVLKAGMEGSVAAVLDLGQ